MTRCTAAGCGSASCSPSMRDASCRGFSGGRRGTSTWTGLHGPSGAGSCRANIGSVASHATPPQSVVSSATQDAVDAITRVLAKV